MQRMKLRCLASSILALAVLLSGSPAQAGKSWKLRFQPKQGSVQHFVVSNELALSAKVPLLGRMGGHLSLRIELRQQVTERVRRGPTTLALIYERIELDGRFRDRVVSYDSAQPFRRWLLSIASHRCRRGDAGAVFGHQRGTALRPTQYQCLSSRHEHLGPGVLDRLRPLDRIEKVLAEPLLGDLFRFCRSG